MKECLMLQPNKTAFMVKLLNRFLAIIVFLSIFGPTVNVQAHMANQEVVAKLQQLIEQQQRQLNEQAKAIKILDEQVDNLTIAVTPDSSTTLSSSTKIVNARDDKVDIQLYAQLDRAMLLADDGNDAQTYHVDMGTRLGLKGNVSINSDVTLGTKFEVAFKSNDIAEISQEDRSVGGDHFSGRHMDIYLDSKRFGKLSLGQGNTASNGSSEIDFSGTDNWFSSGAYGAAEGIYFYNSLSNSLSLTRVGDAFGNMDGLSRRDRIRYDTPDFTGFILSTSFTEESGEDIAARYSGASAGFSWAGAVAYAKPHGLSATIHEQINGSTYLLLDNGLNFTVAAGKQKRASAFEDAAFYYGKIGYRWKLFNSGESAISIDYGHYNDQATDGDMGRTLGIAFVQAVRNWGTQFYVGWRNYDLDRQGELLDDINAIISGARVKF